MKITATSPSDLQLYSSCPYCWFLKKQGHPQKESPAMKFGNRLHQLLAYYHKNYMEPLFVDDDLQDYFDEYKALYDPKCQVVEEFWEVPLFDTDIVLRTKVDLIKDDWLIDHKTSARPYTQEFIDSQFQVTAYAYSWHQQFTEPEKGIRFNVFNTNPKSGQPLLEVFETTRTKEHFDDWELWVRDILKGIEFDYFEPGDGKWHNYEACPKFKENEI